MASTLASLAITMRANAAQVVQELQTVRESITGLQNSVKGMVSAWVSWQGVVAVSDTAKAIKQTKLWADQLGISTQRLTELSAVFQQNANVDGEQFNDMLQELNARLGEAALTGGGPLVEAFDAIGLKFEEVRKLKTDEMLLQIADAFKVMEDQQSLTFAAAEIFAGEAEKIVEVLKDGRGPISEAVAGFRALNGVISDQEAQDAADFATGISTLQTAFGSLGKELTIFIAGPGATVAEWLTETIKNIRQVDDVLKKNQITAQITKINEAIDPLLTQLKNWESQKKTMKGLLPINPEEEEYYKGVADKVRQHLAEIAKLQKQSSKVLPGVAEVDRKAHEEALQRNQEIQDQKIKHAQELAAIKRQLAQDAETRQKEMQEVFGGDPESMFESIQAQYSTELQLLNKHLEDKQELMKKFAKYNIGTEEERAALVNKIAKKHADDTFKLQAKEDAKLKAHKDKFMGHMLYANVKGSKAMLSVQKAFRVAEAVMEGKSAVMSAYKWGNSVGGPVVGAAFAATAAAFSASQVAAIISGGESSATSAATGAASPPDVSTPGLDDLAANDDEPATTKTITVAFEGEGELVPRSVLRELAEELNSLDDSNVRISI